MERKASSVILIVVSALIWGSSFPVIKVTLGGAQDMFSFSFVISFVRLSIAALFGLAMLLAARRFNVNLFRHPVVWILGFLNAISFILQHAGLAFTTASKTSLLVNFNVVFVAALSFVFFRERLGPRKIAGVLLGVGGVVVLETGLDFSFLQHGEIIGDIMVFSAGFTWALYVLFTKRAVDTNFNYLDLSIAVIITTVPFLLFTLPFVDLIQPIAGASWGGILFLGLVTTLPPLIMWSRALKNVTATVSSVLLLFEVLFAVLLSIIAIGETFLVIYVFGGAMILVGGILATSSSDRRTSQRGSLRTANR